MQNRNEDKAIYDLNVVDLKKVRTVINEVICKTIEKGKLQSKKH